MERFLSTLIAVGPLWFLWIALTGSTDPEELAAGFLVAVVVAVLAGGAPFTSKSLKIFEPRRLAYALAYIPYMTWAIVRSNLDVALRVVSPKLPIRPGIVTVKTKLKNPVGRLVLANSITLTPGTLTVDVCGDELCIHWIDVRTEDIAGATREIVGGFEKFLEVIFG